MTLDDNQIEAQKLVRELNQRELQVLAGLVDGFSTTSIAASLSISPQEAARTTNVLMEKLSAKTTADAVRVGLYASVQRPR